MEGIKPHVALLTIEGFELSDGRFYPHPIPLEEDVISLMASMSAKIYGRRSGENRKKKTQLSLVSGGG